jgi:hypothetical protein
MGREGRVLFAKEAVKAVFHEPHSVCISWASFSERLEDKTHETVERGRRASGRHLGHLVAERFGCALLSCQAKTAASVRCLFTLIAELWTLSDLLHDSGFLALFHRAVLCCATTRFSITADRFRREAEQSLYKTAHPNRSTKFRKGLNLYADGMNGTNQHNCELSEADGVAEPVI